MNIKSIIKRGLVALAVLTSAQSFASGISGVTDDCQSNVILGDDNTEFSVTDIFSSFCKSTSHFDYYDPYNPTALNSHYFLIELQRNADISFDTSFGYNTEMYLTRGSALNDDHINLINNVTFLTQGFYILELTSKYSTTLHTEIKLLDTSDNICLKSIELGSVVTDGWHIDCDSNNRDYYDPYGPDHYDSYKAKYFSVDLTDNSDLHIQIESDVETYVYILDGDSEFSVQIDSQSSNDFYQSLPQGKYTFEITTQDKYAPRLI